LVGRSSERAAGARAAAEDAGREAGAGGDIAMRAGEAMHGIEVSSREIRAVLSLINEIAFQTNLLALNAGVEAARAGDAGAGFAVVASEVRALAQRSGEASKQIAALIAACDAQVATGVARVGESREALQRIIAKVTEVSGMFGEIARGAQEQSGKLGALGSAVGELETSVQQNATLAEETNASSRALSGEAERLFGSIGRFRLPAERGALRRAA
jgi:methyl-accepting chemotaxis protein